MALHSENPVVSSFNKARSSSAERVVLFTDMAAYSHWIEEDESATLEYMAGCFDTLRVLAQRFSGTLVKTLGDGALLVFEQADDAVLCGAEFLRINAKSQSELAHPYRFRVGLHKGAVVFRNGDVFGSTVNIASRLQQLARPGQCVVSEKLVETADKRSKFRFKDLGARRLKNIQERIRVFHLIDERGSEKSADKPAVLRLDLLDHVLPNQPFLGPDPTDQHHALALIGYLALKTGHADTVERIATLIFPTHAATEAAARVEQTRQLINEELGGQKDLLELSGDLVVLDSLGLATDLDAHLKDILRGEVPARFLEDADWPDKLLDGFEDIGPMFRSWLQITRDTWKRRVLRALENLIERSPPEDASVEDAANAVLLIEPGHEMAALARINARLSKNDRTGAFAEYERLKSFLSKTYGVSPKKEITARVDMAARGDHNSAPETENRDRPRRVIRISVSQFDSSSASSDTYALPFRAELIANLMRFRDWSVIDAVKTASESSTSSTNIDYTLDLSAFGVSDLTKIGLELRANDIGRIVWAENYKLSEGDLHDTMQSIIRQIVVAVEFYVSSDRLAAVLEGVGRTPTAYDAWLRGDRALMRWSPEGAEEARTIFEGILANDPDNAPALFRIASISNISHIIWPGRVRDAAELSKADKWASRAVELDPMDARIQRTVAWTSAMNGSFTRASMHMDLAASLNPNCPATLASCAMGYAWFGETEKADKTLTQLNAVAFNLPDWIWAYNASTLFFLNRFDEALHAAELGMGSIIDNQGWISAIQVGRGNLTGAHEAFHRLCQDVEPCWAGAAPFDAAAVSDWFVNAYPLRSQSDRERLATAIDAATRLA